MTPLSPRYVLKSLAFAAGLVLAAPFALLSFLESLVSTRSVAFAACGQLLGLVPGPPGTFVRGAYYFLTLRRCSWETSIGFGSFITHREAALGRFLSTGAYCVIGHVDIGDRVMIGSRVSIPSGKRQHLGDAGNIVVEGHFDTVSIGGGTWIGEGAIILADIGGGSIVAAGAVVTKAMPEKAVVGGNPAKVIATVGML